MGEEEAAIIDDDNAAVAAASSDANADVVVAAPVAVASKDRVPKASAKKKKRRWNDNRGFKELNLNKIDIHVGGVEFQNNNNNNSDGRIPLKWRTSLKNVECYDFFPHGNSRHYW